MLRYLSDAYRAFERTIPDSAKSPELEGLIDWLGEVVGADWAFRFRVFWKFDEDG